MVNRNMRRSVNNFGILQVIRPNDGPAEKLLETIRSQRVKKWKDESTLKRIWFRQTIRIT